MTRKRPASEEPAPKRSDEAEQVRLPTSFTRKARMVASGLGISLPEYIVTRLEPLADAELPEVLKALGLNDGGEPTKK